VTARKEDDEKSIYFGPFPSAKAVRNVLKLLRRIFPFHSELHHAPKPCLYYHLQLCPCVPAFDSKHARVSYKKTVSHIIDFLCGKTKKVIKDLEQERDKESKNEQFEKAKKVQEQINAITLITRPFHKPFEYEVNPNLRMDIRFEELQELQKILMQHNISIVLPKRIECYDISNTQGVHATASMVVFTDGEKDASEYRKFKIRYTQGPNDFAMMKEVLTRRLKHSEWPMPDLFIVDGGKGQISSAHSILQENNCTVPLIGLAKKEETIITSSFEEISLPKHAKSLQLIMRIRDEAHRFAISYHKKLRLQATFG
jgi:excinuclease ABC subunit C